MCGRYQFTEEQSAEILRIIQEVSRRYGDDSWTPGEIRPTNAAPVLVSEEQSIVPALYVWGFPMTGRPVINARSETAEEKPMFRESVVSRRCVIPSTGFFEWDGDKRKYLFTLPGEDALYMAGIYTIRDGRPCFCILTTAANESMREVHNRMPLVLEKERVKPWLEDASAARELLHQTPPQLVRAAADAQMRLW